MKTHTGIQQPYPLEVFLLASPTYWPDSATRKQLAQTVQETLTETIEAPLEFTLIDDPAKAELVGQRDADAPVAVLALSGGVQPWMRRVCESRRHIAIFNGYLPEALPAEVAGRLMHANAHPSSTDFFAACRLAGKSVTWLGCRADLEAYALGWQGSSRLQNAHLLKIGQTEPWVINSCREPKTIAERVGTKVTEIPRETLYEIYESIGDDEAQDEAKSWLQRSRALHEIVPQDVHKACRVTLAMRRLLNREAADGLSMACFSMIGDIDTTSCLALSALNDSAAAIGACEGDLDAALTLYLLKSLGADFVWIANPIIHPDNVIDLAHCTAPTCACGAALPFKLMRHHESGRGVAPEVELPGDQTATACRISINARAVACHTGRTQRQDKLPACHTQIRLQVESSQAVLNSLLGTHLVLAYGDYSKAVAHAASFLSLDCQLTRHP